MKISTSTLFIILSFNFSVHCQNIIGVVDYMKVESPETYLKIENSWQKIHEVRLKEGMIVGWGVYQIMFKTVKDSYNYVTITWYDSFSKIDDKIPKKVFNEAFPENSNNDWEDFYNQTENARKIISSGVFHQQISCSNSLDHSGKIYVVNEINVKPGKSKEYLAFKEEIYKPLYEEAIRNNNRTSWSLWAKWPGNMKDFQYISADGYTSLDQIEVVNYLEYFNKIHPEKQIDHINTKAEELRTLVNTEMWKMIYRVLK